jgi:hypothetical protein
MAYLIAEGQREREAKWRDQAAHWPPGREQQVCLAVAKGYADLITLLGRLAFREAVSAQSTLNRLAIPAQPAPAGTARKDQPRSNPLTEAV